MKSFDTAARGMADLCAAVAEAPTHAYLIEAAPAAWESVQAACRAALWGSASDRRADHPDWRIVGQDKRVGRADVEGWPEAVLVPPLLAPVRVLVVLDADRMTDEAQNLLLKVMEEPPASAVTILLAQEAVAVAVTLRSRCRQLRVRAAGAPPAVSEPAQALVDGHLAENWPEALAEAAGAIRRQLQTPGGAEHRRLLVERWRALEAAAHALDGNANRELVAWQLGQALRGRRAGGST